MVAYSDNFLRIYSKINVIRDFSTDLWWEDQLTDNNIIYEILINFDYYEHVIIDHLTTTEQVLHYV